MLTSGQHFLINCPALQSVFAVFRLKIHPPKNAEIMGKVFYRIVLEPNCTKGKGLDIGLGKMPNLVCL